jgi:hypothetical protein
MIAPIMQASCVHNVRSGASANQTMNTLQHVDRTSTSHFVRSQVNYSVLLGTAARLWAVAQVRAVTPVTQVSGALP